jgi:hypothetical protein
VELTSAGPAQMEKRMSSDDLPPGPSDEDLGVLPAPPPYRLDHWLSLLSLEAGSAKVRPELTTDYIRLGNDPSLPLIRHYGSQVLGVIDWTPQAAGCLVDWLCATDRNLTEWRATKITLSDLAERLQAEAERRAAVHAVPELPPVSETTVPGVDEIESKPALDEEDVRILKVLAATPNRLMTREQIAGRSVVSAATVSKRLKSFLKDGYVERPRGPKGGIRLTARGVELLNSSSQ